MPSWYQQNFINSAEDTRTTLNTTDLNKRPRGSAIPNFTKAVKDNLPLDDYNSYGALSVIASELAKNKTYFEIIKTDYLDVYYDLKTDDFENLFNCYCEGLSRVSPLSKQGERPSGPNGNAYDAVLYDVFFDEQDSGSSGPAIIQLFSRVFLESPGFDVLLSCLDQQGVTPKEREENEDEDVGMLPFEDIELLNFGEDNYSLSDIFADGPSMTGLTDLTPPASYNDSLMIYDPEDDINEDRKIQERRRIYELGESHASLLRKKYYGRR